MAEAEDAREKLKRLEKEMLELIKEVVADNKVTKEETEELNKKMQEFRAYIYEDNIITPEEEEAADHIYDEIMNKIKFDMIERKKE